jgi:hypothetical protein
MYIITIMQLQHINGVSSLLFIISTIKAYYCSGLYAWKISNTILIIASYLCNASLYYPPFVLLDYFAIFCVCISYINRWYNIVYIVELIVEYKKSGSITITKNVTFCHAVGQSIINTYLYVDHYHYKVIAISAIMSVIMYGLRQFMGTRYLVVITVGFHICITNILYISSITANP